MVPRNRYVSLATVFVVLLGCTTTNVSPSQTTCTPKEAIACIDTTGCHGYKFCGTDGKGYGSCECDDITETGGTAGSFTASSSTSTEGGTASTSGGTTANTASTTTEGGATSTSGGTTANTASTANEGGATSGNGGTSGANTDTTVVRHAKTCDINGLNCKCLNLISLGAPAAKSYGSGSSTITEFEAWLSTKSNASVTFFHTKPAEPLTAAWLANYDVILLQDLRMWTFTLAEIAAFQAWIKGGGGVIALSGYFSGDALEINNTNALLASTGMSLLATETPEQSCAEAAGIASSNLVCPNSRASTIASKCYCWGNALPLTKWNSASPIATNLTAVGAFRGRAVDPGTAGTTVVSYDTTLVGATTAVGTGRVFLFGDEVVTYYSQWLTAGQPTTDPYNPCWDETAATSCLSGHVFQPKQFWYNAINYVAPPTECAFVVNEPEVVIR